MTTETVSHPYSLLPDDNKGDEKQKFELKGVSRNKYGSNSICDCSMFKLEDNGDKFEKTVSGKNDRKLTDPVCLIILIAMIIADICIFGIAKYKKADPIYIYTGDVYNGTKCDDKTAWFNISYPDIRRCVESCDEIKTYNATLFLDHWCIPDPKKYAKLYDSKAFNFDVASATYVRVIADLWTLRLSVLIISIGSIITSLIYLYMIRINYRLIAYIFMNVICGIIAGSLLIYHGYGDLKSKVTDNTAYIEIIQGSFVLILALMIAIWFIKDKAALTTEIEMMAEAIEAIWKLWSVVLFAAIYALFVLGFAIYWVLAALHIYSVPRITTHEIPKQLIQSIPGQPTEYQHLEISNYKYLLIFHIIFALYMTFIFCYFGYLVLSHVILVWYLGKDEPLTGCCMKKKDKQLTQSQITWESVGTIFKYHIGTASFAAIMASMGIPDIAIFFRKLSKWLCPRIKSKCCKYNKNEQKQNISNRDQQNKTIEMMIDRNSSDLSVSHSTIRNENDKIRRHRMYTDVKKEVFPLIEERITSLAYEYMVSAVIDTKIQNITGKHYIVNNERKYDNDDSDDDIDETDTGSTILSVIKQNMKQFQYEKYIKEDIDKVIDEEIEKLDKKVIKKRKDKQQKIPINEKLQFEIDVIEDKNENYAKMRKEGLIFSALYGTSFCFSSYRSSKLEKQNVTRLNVSGYSEYNERFGRIGIASFNTAVAVVLFFYLDQTQQSISSFIMPSLFIFMVSYTIGYIFTMILEVTVSSLLFCVMLNEDRWNEVFAINQGRIKNNVSKLGNSLSAMLSEHLLIMQLKDRDVNNKIKTMNKFIQEFGDENNLSKLEIQGAQEKLRKAKKDALSTERALLESIDGPIKLTEYLINVVLVENHFNSQYKDKKSKQEAARRKYAKHIFKETNYENTSKSSLKVKVEKMGKVKSFLDYFPISDPKLLENEWKKKIEDVVAKLYKIGLQFKLSGAKSKGIARAFYKSFYSYHDKPDGFLYLTDVLRCSFVFTDFNNLYGCFVAIVGMTDDFEILRVKDRFNSISEPCGYRDLMINVFCKNAPQIEGIICEIQLHHEIFYKAKKVSHRMYKRTRLFDSHEGDGVNEAYEYAKKYIRPVLGRFKRYPIEDEEQDELNKKSDIMKIIQPKITKLAYKYCEEQVIPNLPQNVISNYDLSVLARDKSYVSDVILPYD